MGGGEDALVGRNSGGWQKRQGFFLASSFVYLQAGVFIFTFITGVNSFGQQEAAELVFGVDGVLDFHQVGGHAEGIVLQVPPALLTTTGDSSSKQPDSNCTNLKSARLCDLTLFQLTTRGRYCPASILCRFVSCFYSSQSNI